MLLSYVRRFSYKMLHMSRIFKILITSLFTIGTLLILSTSNHLKFSQETSDTFLCGLVLKRMCSEYNERKISGNLCKDICRIPISRINCLRPPGNGGKTVMLYTDEIGIKLVLKSAAESADGVPPNAYLKSITSRHQGLKHLKLISNHTSFNQSMFSRFLKHINYADEDIYAQLFTGELLINQEEYVKFNELQNTNIVPKLYGACGRYYVTEYTPIHDTVNVNSLAAGLPWTSVGSWERRRFAALGLLELADRLDRHGLSFCDVKGENFGWLEDGTVVALDVDSLFSTAEVGKALKAICSKVYLPSSSNAFHGLLSSVPKHRKDITDIMKQLCYPYAITRPGHRRLLEGLRSALIVDVVLG